MVYCANPNRGNRGIQIILGGFMQSIHEILKSIGIEIPQEKKPDFDKTFIENYKTIAEVTKISDKLNKSNNDLNEAKESLTKITNDFNALKESNASAEDFKSKYEMLVAENAQKEEERQKAEKEAAERAEFDKYFSDNKKDWNNPFIADGYFNKYKQVKDTPEYKGKTTADILHELTKDDSTAFKGVSPDVKLPGASPIGGNTNRLAEIYKGNPFFNKN